jgi:hypothetical protein
MSRTRRSAVVFREYRPRADDCARALQILLDKSAMKMAAEPAPEPDGRDDSTKLRKQSKEATMT